jgi:hypothetical protein
MAQLAVVHFQDNMVEATDRKVGPQLKVALLTVSSLSRADSLVARLPAPLLGSP